MLLKFLFLFILTISLFTTTVNGTLTLFQRVMEPLPKQNYTQWSVLLISKQQVQTHPPLLHQVLSPIHGSCRLQGKIPPHVMDKLPASCHFHNEYQWRKDTIKARKEFIEDCHGAEMEDCYRENDGFWVSKYVGRGAMVSHYYLSEGGYEDFMFVGKEGLRKHEIVEMKKNYYKVENGGSLTIVPSNVERIERFVEKDGFHRELVTKVWFKDLVEEFVLYEQLSSSVYVDPFELANLEEFMPMNEKNSRKIHYVSIMNDHVNVEKPQLLSPVILLSHDYNDKLTKNITFRLPVHFRYQTPQQNHSFRQISIGRCDTGRKVELQELLKSDLVVSQPVSCPDVIVSIPTGQLSHYYLVQWVTLATSIGGACLVIFFSLKNRI